MPSRKLWGARAIGAAIERTEKQVFYLHAAGHLKSIRKIGDELVADLDLLLREVAGQPASDEEVA
jgi:hypothetical protein